METKPAWQLVDGESPLETETSFWGDFLPSDISLGSDRCLSASLGNLSCLFGKPQQILPQFHLHSSFKNLPIFFPDKSALYKAADGGRSDQSKPQSSIQASSPKPKVDQTGEFLCWCGCTKPFLLSRACLRQKVEQARRSSDIIIIITIISRNEKGHQRKMAITGFADCDQLTYCPSAATLQCNVM